MLEDVAIADAAVAISLLLFMQWVLTKLIYHFRIASQVVKAEPTMLVERGEYIEAAMRRERITKDEVRAAIRQSGQASVADARWVILETDGSLAVIPMSKEHSSESAIDVL
ncbi:hypothetical protein DB30_06507 [Enhygromyxa salina]|uniref:YetF C-terminal domain-containing protein n=2 Tax=Enhygromyxa salina TaxID=215803 RepID=A0A0C1ZU90_9BACT|nr:hypothetical protein DB30_06507 [Enhygromyxa salina]